MNSGLFMNRLITIGHSGFTNMNRGLIGENVGLNVILMSNVILSLMSILIVSMENGLIPEVNWEVGLIIFVFTIKKVLCTYIPASFYFLRQFEYNIVIKKCIKTQWNELLKFIDLQLCTGCGEKKYTLNNKKSRIFTQSSWYFRQFYVLTSLSFSPNFIKIGSKL